MSMMSGLVSITTSEFDQYFEKSADFVCVHVPEFYHLLALDAHGFTIVAYKDFNGECFSRSCYWRVE